VVPLTLIEAGPCRVTQIKKREKDKYEAIQFGFEKLRKANGEPRRTIKKTMKGKEFRYLREIRDNELAINNYELGGKIDVAIFKEGDKVSVSGISKGKGFAGGVKRWGFHGKNTTHGTKHEVRTPGSVGSRTPSRVVKGRKMPGRMGGERVTVKNLKVIKIDKENNLLAVKGAIPGRRGTLLEIKSQ